MEKGISMLRSVSFIIPLLVISLFITECAEASVQKLYGRILLQVEKYGQAWYLDPVGGKRAFLGRPDDAFRIMRGFGLGVSNADMDKIKESKERRAKLAGRILIQVEDKGRAFYVYPGDLALYYLGRPKDAFEIMRTLALGISNENLAKVDVNPDYTDVQKIAEIPAALTGTFTVATSTRSNVSNGNIIAANPCKSFDYSQWGACSPWGNRTRTIMATYPAGCSGGEFILEQKCPLAAGQAMTTLTGADSIASTSASSTIMADYLSLATSTQAVDDLLVAAGFLDLAKNVGLSCKPWINKVISFISGGKLVLPFNNPGNASWDINPTGRFLPKSIAIESAGRADLVQMNMASKNNLPHTAIIAATTPTGMVWLHSNWLYPNTVAVDFITYEFFNAVVGNEFSIYHLN